MTEVKKTTTKARATSGEVTKTPHQHMKVHEYKHFFGLTEDELLPISRSILSVEEDIEVDENEFSDLEAEGYVDIALNNMKISFEFTGIRDLSDDFQNLLFDEMIYDLDKRRGYYKLVNANGKVRKGRAIIRDIKGLSGDAAENSEISFKITVVSEFELEE